MRYAGRESNEAVSLYVYMESLNHLETCINALHRVAALYDRMKRAKEVPLESTDLLPAGELKQIERLRHASEHIDSFVRKGNIGKDEPVMMRPWCEGITFAGEEVTYITLARWLTKLHDLGVKLVNYDPASRE